MSIKSLDQEDHIYVINGYQKNKKTLEEPIFLELLSNYVDISQINISKTPSGKPMIAGSPLQFSLAHSGDILLAGFSLSPIGVDIELIKKRKHQKAIARKYGFSKDAQVDLEYFYREWVAREAFIKFKDGTLSQDLARIKVEVQDEVAMVLDGLFYEVRFFTPKDSYIAGFCCNSFKKIKISHI